MLKFATDSRTHYAFSSSEPETTQYATRFRDDATEPDPDRRPA